MRCGEILTRFGVRHTTDIYDPGNHTSHVGQQIEGTVLPFFTANLAFEGPDGG